MDQGKARFVTFCQQLLATGCVLATAVAAAGVVTLDIARPEQQRGPADWRSAVRLGDAYVEEAPVRPTVQNVAVHGIAQPEPRDQKPSRRERTQPEQAQRPARPGGLRLAVLTAPQRVHGYATVGATWDGDDTVAEDDVTLSVRTLDEGRWSDWQRLEYHADHGADPDGPDADARNGTEPLVVGAVDRAQLSVATRSGKAPRGLQFALVNPGSGHVRKAPAQDASGAGRLRTDQGDLALAAARQPSIRTRRDWGADESLRDGSPRYGTIKTGFVHHTVNTNSYSREQVPTLLRSIYAYHTQSRGWSDIGYNFLVDRFGQIWEGRAGGIDKAVIGAHTLGYNEVSFAMSAIGNFDVASPPQAVVDAYARLFAWKLSKYGVKADATRLWVKNRYLQGINGHRDVGSTACPGRYLYARLGDIRAAARRIQRGGAAPSTPTTPTTPTPSPTPTTQPTPTGTFGPVPESRLPKRSNIAGSGWPDLLVRQRSSGKVLMFRTDGQLNLRRISGWAGLRRGERVTGAGDLTGDGRGDLLASSTSAGTSRVLRGDGSGGFTSGTRSTRFAGYRWLLGGGDLTGDGRDDLIAREKAGPRLLLLARTGKDAFAKPVTLARDWSQWTRTVLVPGFGGSAAPDLVVSDGSGRLSWVAGRKSTLAAPVRLGHTLGRGEDLAGGGDLTGDRLGDVVVRRDDGRSTYVLPGTGAGEVRTALGPFGALAGLVGTSAAQLTGGPGSELVGRTDTGRIRVVGSTQKRNLKAAVDTGIVMKTPGQLLNVGDWNRDGHTDLVSRPAGGRRLSIRLGTSDRTWGPHQPLARGFGKITRLAAVGDVTGDGRPDLAGSTNGGPMLVWPGAGRRSLGSPVKAPAKLRSYNQIGRGLWRPGAGSSFLSSDGGFVPTVGSSAAAALAAGPVAGKYDWLLGPGDVDTDGVADLVAREPASGLLWLLPGTTSGTFGQRRLIGAGFGGYDVLG